MRRFKFPKLSHPWAKSKAGFTLVELVVVIAILGILAGVGTVGYSGYVKSAQKKADQTLVANIVRAIETGTNSTMFSPPNSIAASATTFPVGFIVLTADGGKTVTSNATYKGNINDECVFTEQPVEVTYVEKGMKKMTGCSGDMRAEIYTKKSKSISYCLTHSTGTLGVGENNRYPTDNECEEGGCGVTTHTAKATAYLSFDSDENFVADIDTLFVMADNGKCSLAANPGLVGNTATSAAITSNNAGNVMDSHVLSQSIRAAFGDNADLSLQYAGWGADVAHSISTFYSYAPNLMTEIQELGTNVLTLQAGGSLVDMGMTKHYDSTEEMLGSFAKVMVEKFPEPDAWEVEWMNAVTGPIKNGFGLPGRENYSAARLGYNRAFMSYMEANGASDTVLEVVKEYNELGALPLTICDKAFDSTQENNIVGKLDNEDDLNMCRELYDAYKTSEVCRENARTFYNTIVTIEETHGAALDESTGNYFDYYNSYLSAISELYSKAQDEGKEGIIIAVSVEQGVVKCEVSPSDADLRNS